MEFEVFMVGIQQVGNQTATIIALCNLADFDLTAHFCQVPFLSFLARYLSSLFCLVLFLSFLLGTFPVFFARYFSCLF